MEFHTVGLEALLPTKVATADSKSGNEVTLSHTLGEIARVGHLLHVGHSSFEGGCPLGQFLAWQGVDDAELIVVVARA
jgi:hypothetical protein